MKYQYKNTVISTLTTEDTSGETPLFYSQNLKFTKLLVENGADINHRNKNGKTVLECSKHKRIIKTLREMGQSGS